MKRLFAVLTALVTVATTVVGCSSESEAERVRDSIRPQHLQVDGHPVTCLVYSGYKQGGLSCDWSDTK